MTVHELANTEVKDRAVQALEWSRKITLQLLKDFPEDKAVFQTCPTDNHALWTLGHLAVTDDWVRGLIQGGDSTLPESYGKLFGYQTKVESSAQVYPAFAEVKQNFQAARDALLRAIAGASDEAFAQSLTEKTGGFATDLIDIIQKSAWHEGWHTGQIAHLRKAIGLKFAI